MSSSTASLTAAPSIPGAQATFTARNAGCGIVANALSASSVDGVVPQSLNVHCASGEPLQSPPGQKRPGGGIGAGSGGDPGRAIDPGAIWFGSPSDISACQRVCPSSAGMASPVQPG